MWVSEAWEVEGWSVGWKLWRIPRFGGGRCGRSSMLGSWSTFGRKIQSVAYCCGVDGNQYRCITAMKGYQVSGYLLPLKRHLVSSAGRNITVLLHSWSGIVRLLGVP